MRITIATATVLVLALSGCTSEPQARYDTVVDLRDAYVAAGGACPEWVEGNHITKAAQSGDCDSSTVLSIYLNESGRDSVIADMKSLSLGDMHLLVGENWVINTKDPEAYLDSLGGTVIRD
jgi:hypothetical protein